MFREEDRKQVIKAIDFVNKDEVRKAYLALVYRCEHNPIRLAVRYAKLTTVMLNTITFHAKTGNKEIALKYKKGLQAIKSYMDNLNEGSA